MIIPPELGPVRTYLQLTRTVLRAVERNDLCWNTPCRKSSIGFFFDDRPGVSRQLWDILLTLIEIVPVYKWVSWVGVGERPRL
jgi:hypothetical protein